MPFDRPKAADKDAVLEAVDAAEMKVERAVFGRVDASDFANAGSRIEVHVPAVIASNKGIFGVDRGVQIILSSGNDRAGT